MRIAAFELVNYKSFADPGEVRLKPGFNAGSESNPLAYFQIGPSTSRAMTLGPVVL